MTGRCDGSREKELVSQQTEENLLAAAEGTVDSRTTLGERGTHLGQVAEIQAPSSQESFYLFMSQTKRETHVQRIALDGGKQRCCGTMGRNRKDV